MTEPKTAVDIVAHMWEDLVSLRELYRVMVEANAALSEENLRLRKEQNPWLRKEYLKTLPSALRDLADQLEKSHVS